MKLWTMVNQEQLDYLNKHGYLKTDGRRIDPYFRKAYQWLIKQMAERVGPSPKGIMYPIWAYYQWDGKKRPRPDLRNLRWDWSGGGTFYRLELEIDEERVMLTDYDGWHCVLSDWHFALNEEEADDFDKRYDALDPKSKTWGNRDEGIMKEIEDSWQHILDMDSPRIKDWHGCNEVEDIQATFWILYKDDIVKMDKFESRLTKWL